MKLFHIVCEFFSHSAENHMNFIHISHKNWYHRNPRHCLG